MINKKQDIANSQSACHEVLLSVVLETMQIVINRIATVLQIMSPSKQFSFFNNRKYFTLQQQNITEKSLLHLKGTPKYNCLANVHSILFTALNSTFKEKKCFCRKIFIKWSASVVCVKSKFKLNTNSIYKLYWKV